MFILQQNNYNNLHWFYPLKWNKCAQAGTCHPHLNPEQEMAGSAQKKSFQRYLIILVSKWTHVTTTL